jgi:hypothetical protein
MRTRRWVFWFSVAMLMGSLIIYGKCQAHPVYDERGNIVGETLEDHTGSVYEAQSGNMPHADWGRIVLDVPAYPSDSVTITKGDITALLRECLEYIEDSSVIYNDPSDRDNYLTESVPAIYQLRSAQTDADEAAQTAQERADRIKAQAEQLRKETELNKKIKAMIKKLEGENK